MNDKVRFSKTSVVNALRDRACFIRAKHRIDPADGTRQLLPMAVPRSHEAQHKLIDRAAGYGEFMILMNLAQWIESGEFPTEN